MIIKNSALNFNTTSQYDKTSFEQTITAKVDRNNLFREKLQYETSLKESALLEGYIDSDLGTKKHTDLSLKLEKRFTSSEGQFLTEDTIQIKHEIIKAKEQVDLTINGIIKLADGSTIDLKYHLDVDNEYTEDSFERSRLYDPLVINFKSPDVQVTNEIFKFDMNSDGQTDLVTKLGHGSGFLALDKNGNEKIDNGKELFGATNGNGFEELREYDLDNSGWIDENDEVFQKLKIMTIDENGHKQLTSLKDLGIGAINLDNQMTRYSKRNLSSAELAEVQSTTVFIREDHSIGTIQQVDLKVHFGIAHPSLSFSSLQRMLEGFDNVTTTENEIGTTSEKIVSSQNTVLNYSGREKPKEIEEEKEKAFEVDLAKELEKRTEQNVKNKVYQMNEANLKSILKMV
ncbi:MAG: hypothetical protein OIF32_02065 [Campylobacterales bacterium]|nr:hypothetical protein [Campylobacterales bacterium]